MTSGGPRQHSSEKISKPLRAVDDTLRDLTGLGVQHADLPTYRTDSDGIKPLRQPIGKEQKLLSTKQLQCKISAPSLSLDEKRNCE